MTVTDQPESSSDGWVGLVKFLVLMVIEIIIFIIIGYLYAKYKPDDLILDAPRDIKSEELNSFKYGLLQCYQLPLFSLFTCCCPCARWADSTRMFGMLPFIWGMAWWWGFTDPTDVFWTLIGWVVLALVGTYYRQRMRRLFYMENSNGLCCLDWLGWCCCPCCSIVQEARQVELAKVLGHEALYRALPLQCACE